MMGEKRCFVCWQGFGRGRRGKVRAFLGDGTHEDAEACVICVGVVRDRGEVELERGGERVVVRELVPPLADVPRP